MKVVVLCLVALAAACYADITEMNNWLLTPPAIDAAWSAFKAEYEKNYESALEEVKRMEIFADNLRKITLHNYLHSKGLKTYTMGVNAFTDLSHSEFLKRNGLKKAIKTSDGTTYLSPNVELDLPSSVDWRKKGYVTPIKDQGDCGSCWAFSSTGSLEGQHFRKTQKLVSLSEQNLVDCSTSFGNEGCGGGLMDNAFQYIKANKGIDTEASYPYTGTDDKCSFKPKDVGATDSGFVDILSGNEQKLTEAIATVGPISIAIDASSDKFQHYKSGIYDEPDCSSVNLDHGVLVVGYASTKDGQDYYIVKNSWGTTWGQQGYIYMPRNKNNRCGIATQASYPIV